MGNINVIQKNQPVDLVRMFVDGICNHAVTDSEEIENYSGGKGYVTYCSDCDAEYNDFTDQWVLTDESFEDR